MSSILMLVGGVIWLTGELIGVFTNSETTSRFVWALQKKWPIVRVVVAAFVVALGAHFAYHTPLWPF